MTIEEWLSRCAARYIERVDGLTQEQAMDFAYACYDEEPIDCLKEEFCDPEGAADEDMTYWEN